MVIIVDFDEDLDRFHGHEGPHMLDAKTQPADTTRDEICPKPPPRRLFRNAVTDAFAQYPILESLVRHIDLNTLDSLSRTSFLVHEGLLQYRSSLLKATLHCVNSDAPVDPDGTFRFRARAGNHYFDADADARTLRSSSHGHLPYSGKSGQCARDMVSECRKCGVAVCRNCTTKQPGGKALNDRFRRLCVTCVEAPLVSLLDPTLDPRTPLASDEVQRELCQCDQRLGVWLCQPCGRGIRASDSDYQRIWRWRNQYGESLGCLGTGIGEGDRGVICGREAGCLAAKEREQETDCDAEDAREPALTPSLSDGLAPTSESPGTPLHHQHQHQHHNNHFNLPFHPAWNGSGNVSTSSHLSAENNRTPSPLQLGPGYERHEIVGIGGVVKKKLVRMVRVGACVPEWEDEKSWGEVLKRERTKQARSSCGWCCRVIPGERDRHEAH